MVSPLCTRAEVSWRSGSAGGVDAAVTSTAVARRLFADRDLLPVT